MGRKRFCSFESEDFSFIFISLVPVGKSKVLAFDLVGEGNLPCITVVKPVQRTSLGKPVLLFKRLLVGRRQILPLVIKNISNVPAQVKWVVKSNTLAFGTILSFWIFWYVHHSNICHHNSYRLALIYLTRWEYLAYRQLQTLHATTSLPHR